MNINPDFNKILAEALDSWDRICEEQAKANDRLLFDEMLSKGQIKPPVIVCSRVIKKANRGGIARRVLSFGYRLL